MVVGHGRPGGRSAGPDDLPRRQKTEKTEESEEIVSLIVPPGQVLGLAGCAAMAGLLRRQAAPGTAPNSDALRCAACARPAGRFTGKSRKTRRAVTEPLARSICYSDSDAK